MDDFTKKKLAEFEERYPVMLFGENPVVERKIENRREFLIKGKFETFNLLTGKFTEPKLRISTISNPSVIEEVVDERNKEITVEEWRLYASIKKFIAQALQEAEVRERENLIAECEAMAQTQPEKHSHNPKTYQRACKKCAESEGYKMAARVMLNKLNSIKNQPN